MEYGRGENASTERQRERVKEHQEKVQKKWEEMEGGGGREGTWGAHSIGLLQLLVFGHNFLPFHSLDRGLSHLLCQSLLLLCLFVQQLLFGFFLRDSDTMQRQFGDREYSISPPALPSPSLSSPSPPSPVLFPLFSPILTSSSFSSSSCLSCFSLSWRPALRLVTLMPCLASCSFRGF